MTMQSKKQIQNQSQAGYMQSNESQIISGEAGKKEMQIRQDKIIGNQSQSGKMMIKNTQNKKESSKNKSKLSIYKKNIIETRSQSGRSMIEMLGVLAIIAILSIGGIVGFRLAMNYYQANQIAHEMNIMRTDAQIKIAQGAEELMLGEPYDPVSDSQLGHIQFNDAYLVDFDCIYMKTETSEPEPAFCTAANAYYIEMQNIPEGVCRPLANLIDNMDNEIAFYINGNSVDAEEGEKGVCLGEENKLTVIFGADSDSNAIKCDDDPECPEDLPVCFNHMCVECETYQDCQGETPQCDTNTNTCKSCYELNPNKPLWDGTQCVECITYKDCTNRDKPQCDTTNTCAECPQNSFWDGEKCQEGCRENSHCSEDEYCHKLGGSSCEAEWKDAEDFSGSCRKVNDDLIFGTVDGQTYYGSNNTMNWWSVKRFCEAAAQLGHGNGQMAVWGKPDFKCNPSVTLTSSTSQYCHKNGTDVREGDFNDLSTTVEELRKMFGVTHTGEWDAKAIDIWLNNQDSCQLFEIEFSTPSNAEHKAGYIMYNGGVSHLQGANHALCQP